MFLALAVERSTYKWFCQVPIERGENRPTAGALLSNFSVDFVSEVDGGGKTKTTSKRTWKFFIQ